MKIGIIGLGIVGTACKQGFLSVGHTVYIHDTKLNTNMIDVLDTEIIYICVPTPENSDHSCNTSVVDSIIYNLKDLGYTGIVAIKSTVEPGHTDSIAHRTGMQICFVPEFLRERHAVDDFLTSNLLVVGTHSDDVFELVCQSHYNLYINSSKLSPVESEILKYYSNSFNATRVVFANIMYEICQRFDADYDRILDNYLIHGANGQTYLECSEQLRGFGGACLPKDTQALNTLIKQLGFEYKLFESVIHDNQKFKITLRND
jgi:UDPglucose 6-dehydrogenase